jgi:hypothetical protein
MPSAAPGSIPGARRKEHQWWSVAGALKGDPKPFYVDDLIVLPTLSSPLRS